MAAPEEAALDAMLAAAEADEAPAAEAPAAEVTATAMTAMTFAREASPQKDDAPPPIAKEASEGSAAATESSESAEMVAPGMLNAAPSAVQPPFGDEATGGAMVAASMSREASPTVAPAEAPSRCRRRRSGGGAGGGGGRWRRRSRRTRTAGEEGGEIDLKLSPRARWWTT